MSFLLAAEADQIQEYILRSAKLKEVVGASDLLSSFCREVPSILQEHFPDMKEMKVLVNDAGTFRLSFPSDEIAEKAGALLAELYLQIIGGSLSVSSPIEVGDNFSKALKDIRSSLQERKQGKNKTALSAHVPWATFCNSCGTGLGYVKDEKNTGYLCTSCENKRKWRGRFVSENGHALLKEIQKGFLCDFRDELKKHYKGKIDIDSLTLPIGEETAGERSNIAYLVADANGAGMRFDNCESGEALQEMSQKYRQVLAAALAIPCAQILPEVKEKDNPNLPVMPFILGGDDCFARIPDYCALDVAENFCREFYKRLNITVGVAVVICKENYPYRLAYTYARDLLGEAKQLAKRVNSMNSHTVSAVNFTVIKGNELPDYIESSNSFRGYMRPYLFVHSGTWDAGYGSELSVLLEEAKNLRDTMIPATRLQALRRLYDPVYLRGFDFENDLDKWLEKLNTVLDRVGRMSKQKTVNDEAINSTRTVIENTLKRLGSDSFEDGYWRGIYHIYGSNNRYANGIADLIEMWDYCYSIGDYPWRED